MELHLYLQQTSWLATHSKLGSKITAYSPLGNMNPTYGRSKTVPPLINNVLFVKIAEKRGCTAAQVALKWGIGRGTSVIPKSNHEVYIEQNLGPLKCELMEEDVREIERMVEVKRFSDPSEGWVVKLFEGLEDA
jgi:alcohol dehydrogenase (NADP+)